MASDQQQRREPARHAERGSAAWSAGRGNRRCRPAATNGSRIEAKSCSASHATTHQPDQQRDPLAARWRAGAGGGGGGCRLGPRAQVERRRRGRRQRVLIASSRAAPPSRHRRRRRPAWWPPPPRSAPSAAAGAARPKPASSRATATSTICSAVFSLETRAGGCAPAGRAARAPARRRRSPRRGTRPGSPASPAARRPRRGSRRCHQQRLVGDRVEQRAERVAAAARRASQPSTASDRPAATNRQNAAAEPVRSTSQTASGTAHSRAKVMTLGSVSSDGRAAPRPSCVSVRHGRRAADCPPRRPMVVSAPCDPPCASASCRFSPGPRPVRAIEGRA